MAARRDMLPRQIPGNPDGAAEGERPVPRGDRRAPADDSRGDGAIVGHDAIAAGAYALWESRGYQDGSDIDDWLEAEERLREAAREGGASPDDLR